MSRWPGNADAQQTTFGALNRASLMARVRSSGNLTTEKRLASLLRAAGIRGWRRNQRLTGRPDFVWLSARIAVFVDGCFWHGHTCGKNIRPKTNRTAWESKISRNRVRDREVTRALRASGWSVIRIWECTLWRSPSRPLRRIQRTLGQRRAASSPLQPDPSAVSPTGCSRAA
jgi:DNA mismatch endonuclease (patch repair protein)